MSRVTLSLVSVLVLSMPLSAQDLTYVMTTSFELGGSVGAMMSMMPGMDDATRETVYLSGTRMRRDSDQTSTITDWATGDMIIVNHVDRTFVRVNWEDMAKAMAAAMEGDLAEAKVEEEAPDTDPAPTFTTRFDTDRTGRSEDIAGYRAEQVIVTMELEAEMPPEEDEENELSQGSMAVVSELWVSTDFPEWTMMQEAREQMAERLRSTDMGRDMGESLGGLAAMDPRIEVALKENEEALADLEGTGLRTVVNLVSVPYELDLDVDAVLAQSDEKLAPGMGGLAAEGAAAAARSALGGLRSRFGGGRQEEPEEPEPAQSIFLRTISEIGEVDTGPLDDSVFAPPEGYVDVTNESGVGQ